MEKRIIQITGGGVARTDNDGSRLINGWLLVGLLVMVAWVFMKPKREAEVEPPTEPEQFAEYAYLLDTDPEEMRAPVMTIEATGSDLSGVVKKVAHGWQNEPQWRLDDGRVNYFRIAILETKRREALGRPGDELKRYKDGSEWAIGYGNHIKYLSKEWQRTIKRQGYEVTEMQARQMMYQTFHGLDRQIKRDLPHLNHRQRWAVKSLAFNWGYGNVKRSGLWKHLKKGSTGDAVAKAWMRTQVATENHKKSRRMEIALWYGNDNTAIEAGKAALKALHERGDFEFY